MTRLAVACVIALVLVTVGRTGGAQESDTAQAHYVAGTKAFEDADYLKAVEELQDSIRLKPTAKAYFQLGNAYTKQGQLDDAKVAFEKYLALEPKAAKRTTVERLIKELGVLSSTAFKITTTPPGATVYIDLKAEGAKGKTPAILAIPPGRHRVMLELEGHEGVTIPDALAVENKVTPLEITLKAKGCDADLRTANKDTQVRVDVADPVPTPATVRVKPGEHRVLFLGEGMKSKTRMIRCETTEPIYVEEQLENEPQALLVVHAPKGARVTVDGRLLPVATNDLYKREVVAGSHTVDVAFSRHVPWHGDVALRGGEHVDVTPRMEEGADGSTSIEVLPTPPNAVIYVDGELVPDGELATVTPGRHAVEVRARGFHKYRQIIEVKQGRSAYLDATLQPRGRWPLYLGVAALVVAGGIEATTLLWPRQQAGRSVAGSADYDKWHTLEGAGHITAGVVAGVGVASLVGYAIAHYRLPPPDESGPPPPGPPARTAAPTPAPRPTVGATLLPGGGALTVIGSF